MNNKEIEKEVIDKTNIENKNLEEETGNNIELRDNSVKDENLIDLNTEEGYQYSQDFDKEKYLRAVITKNLLNKSIKPILVNEKELKIIGTRSQKNLIHQQLEPVTRKNKIKMDPKISLDKAVSLIPMCSNDYESYLQFINAGDLAIESVDKEYLPLLIKYIKTKMSGKALNVCRYRDTSTWENIKSILKNAYELQLPAQTLHLSLNSIYMLENEDVATYSNRVESTYYDLCNASTKGKTPEESKIIRQQLKELALGVYIQGLIPSLRNIIKPQNPPTLELAMQLAKQEQIEAKHNNNNINRYVQNESKNENNKNYRNNNNENINRQNFNQANRQNFNNYRQNYNQGSYDRQNFNRNNNFNRQNFNRNNGDNFYRENNFNKPNFNRYNTGNTPNRNNTFPRNNNNQYNNNNNPNNNKPIGINCHNCGKYGHYARDCRSNRSNINNTRPPIQNNYRPPNVSNNYNNNTRALNCNYCKKLGHDITNCYSKMRNDNNVENKNSKNTEMIASNGVRTINQLTAVPYEVAGTSSQQ